MEGSKVLMYDGSLKSIEKLIVGDTIMGDDSTPRTVLIIKTFEDNLFNVSYNDGTFYTIGGSQMLCLIRSDAITETILNVFLKMPPVFQQSCIGFRKRVIFKKQITNEEPYNVGLKAGSGQINNIPLEYKSNDIDVMYDVLRGIVDASGGESGPIDTEYRLNLLPTILEDAIFIARSLGYHVYKRSGLLFLEQTSQTIKSFNISIRSLGKGTCYSFAVNGNKRYIGGDFTVMRSS